MDALPISNLYQLEYGFAQGEMPGAEAIADKVREAHGICWILAMDFLDATLNDKAFVVSMSSVHQKNREIQKIYANGSPDWNINYGNYKPNLRLGQSRNLALDVVNCNACAHLLGNGNAALLHLGQGLDSNETSHALAIVKKGGTYHMFDPNIGVFTSNSANNCGRWIYDICDFVRSGGRGKYRTWAEKISPVRFS